MEHVSLENRALNAGHKVTVFQPGSGVEIENIWG
jgi:hypothetical protein